MREKPALQLKGLRHVPGAEPHGFVAGDFRKAPPVKKILREVGDLRSYHPDTISFSYNLISSLDKGALASLRCLNLDLSHNKLKTIPAGVFSKSNVSHLKLTDNQIEAIADGAFTGVEHIYKLDLAGNSLQSIPVELVKLVKNYTINFIVLTHNPIVKEWKDYLRKGSAPSQLDP